MRFILTIIIVSIILSAACGGEPETEVPPDGAASAPQDSVEIQPEHFTSPQDAISGAYNLIEDARSVTDEANARIEELEQLMGDN
ncbi:MAG: hypothetical protein KAR44_10640 [Candidatus Aegiribacteria sp.]|nr:hypothetical protein [Candidatus Aegiribacteria sp.]